MEVRKGEKEKGEKEASKEKERAGKGKKRMAGGEEKISWQTGCGGNCDWSVQMNMPGEHVPVNKKHDLDGARRDGRIFSCHHCFNTLLLSEHNHVF